jgi:fibronectin type 3 domain-containing protein
MDPSLQSPRFVRLRLGAPARAAGVTEEQALATLRHDPCVRIAEPDYPVHASALPNDPRFPQLWGLHNTGQSNGVSDVDIDAPEAWDTTTGSPTVTVAVIDTGVDYNHPDLRDNILRAPDGNVVGWDFANGDANPLDDNNHGTHVAGTIGAEGNNALGVIGVSPTVRLMPVKFLGADGSGSTANAILAIDFAITHGARILNCSWGGGGLSDLLLEALQRAERAGVLVVAAAGNESVNNDETPSYPANYNQFCDNLLSVAATDNRDELAGFSNYGRDTVDLCAPGVGIVSTLPNNNYGSYSGTSMATPHVSGTAALLLSRYPNLSLAQLRHRLLFNTDSVPALAAKVPALRLNAARALEADTAAPGTPGALTVTHLAATGLLLSWTASGDDGPLGRASGYELRVSDQPLTEDSFAGASRAQWLPRPAASGAPETYLLSLLAPGQTIYVALRAIDNAGNTSPLTMLGPLRIAESSTQVTALQDDVEGVARFTGTTPWAISTETSYRGSRCYTDSPGAPYALNANTSLTQTAGVALSGFVPVLRFQARTDLEPGFDFLYAEASGDDGESWSGIDLALTGKQEWNAYTVSLGRFYGRSVRIRFRLVSDDVITAQGVWLDDIQISGSQLVSLATAPPAAPVNLTASSVSASQVELSWTDHSDNETSFKIERRTGQSSYTLLALVGADFTHFSDSDVAANTLYTYRVRASNAAGDSAAVVAGSVLTLPDPPPPPGLLAATGDATGIQLSWHAAAGAQSYRVKRASTAGGPYTVLVSVSATSYRDATVTSGATYYYVATSVGPGGESVNGNEASASTASPSPNPPTAVRARAQSGQVQLTWTQSNSPAIQSNRIYRAIAPGGPYMPVATIAAKKRYIDRKPGGRGSYYYRVTAVDARGLESVQSSEAPVIVGAMHGRH